MVNSLLYVVISPAVHNHWAVIDCHIVSYGLNKVYGRYRCIWHSVIRPRGELEVAYQSRPTINLYIVHGRAIRQLFIEDIYYYR